MCWIVQRSRICSLTSKLSDVIPLICVYPDFFLWWKLVNLVEADAVFSSIPLFPSHKPNYMVIKSQPTDKLAWSLFCASDMPPKHKTPQFPPHMDTSASNLVAKADTPPAWAEKYRRVPLIGGYLNIMAQAQDYFCVLENCVDFIATDLEKKLESEWIGKRVGVKERSKIE